MDVGEQRRRPGPAPAVVTGPLTPYVSAIRSGLTDLGYTPLSVGEAIRTLRWLSGWMDRKDLAAQDLTPDAIAEFLAERRKLCSAEGVARRWVGAVVGRLRGLGVIPGRDFTVTSTPVESLLVGYRAYLAGERGLAAESVRCYGNQASKFLVWLPEPLEETLAGLGAAVTAFIVDQSIAANSVWSAKALVTATRSLLQFLHVQGKIPAPLTAAVPGVAGWRLSTLPRGLDREQVDALLAGCDTGSSAGLRDHAILTVLARLGLRGAEAAALRLDDVDWRQGEIVVRGKGSRVERLPLPQEVGQELAAYITGGRPTGSCPTLFVTDRVPYRPLSGHCIRAVMGRACRRAGLKRLGAHRLRHTLATDLLRAGAPLTEVGQLLRHRSQLSTTVYAKVDHEALRALARPWPGDAR